jgi:hypothetical protein
MEKSIHTLCDLFEQLGLPCSAADIDAFIDSHRPLAAQTALFDAPFWNPSQREFLSQQLSADADWAELVDQLNVRLR